LFLLKNVRWRGDLCIGLLEGHRNRHDEFNLSVSRNQPGQTD